MWDELELLESAESLVELLPDLIAKDEQLDIIGGAAGCIASLLNLYSCTPSQRTLRAVIQCGDRLIAHAQTMEHGIGWIAPAIVNPLIVPKLTFSRCSLFLGAGLLPPAFAYTIWQKAVAALKVSGDELSQAVTMGNISLAYQQLGQWTEATGAIAQSLNFRPQIASPPT